MPLRGPASRWLTLGYSGCLVLYPDGRELILLPGSDFASVAMAISYQLSAISMVTVGPNPIFVTLNSSSLRSSVLLAAKSLLAGYLALNQPGADR